MIYFITGASGFIGSHLLHKLLKFADKDDILYCLVRHPKKSKAFASAQIRVLKGDHTSLHRYTHVLLKANYIYHVAAKAEFGNGKIYYEHNILFTSSLVEIVKKSKNLKRFIFISSIAAVDRMPKDDCLSMLTEVCKPNPSSDYGKSKLACEKIIQQSSLPYVILRPTWVYGPGMRKNSHIRVFIDGIQKGKFFSTWYFPGSVSLIYIDDLISAIQRVSVSSKSLRKTYFVSDGNPIPIGKIFQTIGAYLGNNSGFRSLPSPVTGGIRRIRRFLPLTIQNLFLNILCADPKALMGIGFKPRFGYERGIIETIRWHNEQAEAAHNVHSRSVWITGGANGIGLQTAIQLYAKGYDLVIIDKDKTNFSYLHDFIHAKNLYADFSNIRSIHTLASILKKYAHSIHIFINNAGIGSKGSFWDISTIKHEKILMVNAYAPIVFSHALLSVWVHTKGLHSLINIASSAGFQPMPLMSLYGSSKSFLLRFSQSITGEIGLRKQKNIEIITVSPSGTATNFQKVSGVKNAGDTLLTPEYVASRITNSIGKGSRSIIIGYSGMIMNLYARIVPSEWLILFWSRLMKKYR
jgi:hypothetical protein